MDSDSDTNLSVKQTRLERTLLKYSHLNLTSSMVPDVAFHQGGGGFSDVFQSVLDSSWKPRPDPIIATLLLFRDDTTLKLKDAPSPGDSPPSEISKCIMVAVKRLRFWDRPVSKLEKVISSSLFTTSFINIYSRRSPKNSGYGSVYPIPTFYLSWGTP